MELAASAGCPYSLWLFGDEDVALTQTLVLEYRNRFRQSKREDRPYVMVVAEVDLNNIPHEKFGKDLGDTFLTKIHCLEQRYNADEILIVNATQEFEILANLYGYLAEKSGP